jgi:DNA-binding transcriptional regulator YhcF (GntR family)
MVTIDLGSPIPPYEQVRAQLAQGIVDGELAVGARLPTVRGLAADLGLAVNTVARAYRELEDAGLIETRGRAGSVVAAGGDRVRAEVQRAAHAYAQLALRLGLDRAEARRIVEAALA